MIVLKLYLKRNTSNYITLLVNAAYAHTIVHELGLSQANVSPLMTPFRSGLPVDAIPKVELTSEARTLVIAKMQCWLGMIN